MTNDDLRQSARRLAAAAGHDPDERVTDVAGKAHPRWTEFLTRARQAPALAGVVTNQPASHADAPLTVFGPHEAETVEQMRGCMKRGRVAAGVLCADGHLGYAQPVGGVIAYEGQISISGVGFDIGCGNLAARLDTRFEDIRARAPQILEDIRRVISFGVGRANAERVEHPLFDDQEVWETAGTEEYRQKAEAQLGTVGSGNHYVDLFHDQGGFVWIGVHFGSRGLGHTSATRYMRQAGGKGGMLVAPAVVEADSEFGRRYIAAMQLAGRYAQAGREWVVERVRRIIGGAVTESVHNHHNYAWEEEHDGRRLWVVRKGATPAFPGQKGFVGGSMGDDAVILEGVDSARSRAALYSTVHGAGRLFGRRQAIKTFTRRQMDDWLRARGVLLAGGDLDESPMAYRRLPDVLAEHQDTVRILHTLRPFAVAMAGRGEFDPFKD